MKGHIYIIRNLINGKGYVGQTRVGEVEKRWNKHKENARRNFPELLYIAIRKYGIENFKCVRLISCDVSLVDEMEIYFIKKCETYAPTGHGYNMTLGGDRGSEKRPPRTAEHQRKLSEALRGRKRPARSDQWKRRISEGNRGKIHSEEHKVKISNSMKGKLKAPQTEEHRANISKAKKGQNAGKPWSVVRRLAEDRKANS